jgi:hypothetical protein
MRVNISSPLPTDLYDTARRPRRSRRMDLVLAPESRGEDDAGSDLQSATRPPASSGAAERWRNDLTPRGPSAFDLEFTSPDAAWNASGGQRAGGLNSDKFLWLWASNRSNASEPPRAALRLPAKLSKWALQLAVLANGGALVALAVLQLVDASLRTSLTAAALVLGLGLLFAATATILAYLNFQLTAFCSAPAAIRVKASYWLAIVSGAGSFAAVALAAPWLIALAANRLL